MNATRPDVDHEEDEVANEPEGPEHLDGEEVGSGDRAHVGAEERRPGRVPSSFWSWFESTLEQDPLYAIPPMALIVPLVSWMAFIAPWIISARDSYYYHYRVPYAFGLLIVGGLISRLRRAHPWLTVGIALLVLAVFAFSAPVWAQLPISDAAAKWRLPLRLWR